MPAGYYFVPRAFCTSHPVPLGGETRSAHDPRLSRICDAPRVGCLACVFVNNWRRPADVWVRASLCPDYYQNNRMSGRRRWKMAETALQRERLGSAKNNTKEMQQQSRSSRVDWKLIWILKLVIKRLIKNAFKF